MDAYARKLPGDAPASLPEAPLRRAVSPPAQVLALQRAAGNQAVTRMLARGTPPVTYPHGPTRFPEMDPWLPPGGFDPVPGEYAKFEPLRARNLFEDPSIDGYRALRPYFLGAFGMDADGAEKAVERALAYYGKLVKATLLGKPEINVHPAMQTALAIADAKLKGKGYTLATLGGARIRFARDSGSMMSNHSWGAAVDLNGDTSPMTYGLGPGASRVQLIDAITGTDVSEDRQGNQTSHVPKSQVDMTLEAARLQKASQELVDAFKDWSTVAATAFRIASERGKPTGKPDDIYKLLISQGEPNEVRQAVRDFVFPSKEQATHDWDPAFMDATVDILQTIGRIWLEIEEHGRDTIDETAHDPSDAQLAVHGFESIPPEVVGALSGADAGNLAWEGTNKGGMKDFMHFDLRDIPPLY